MLPTRLGFDTLDGSDNYSHTTVGTASTLTYTPPPTIRTVSVVPVATTEPFISPYGDLSPSVRPVDVVAPASTLETLTGAPSPSNPATVATPQPSSATGSSPSAPASNSNGGFTLIQGGGGSSPSAVDTSGISSFISGNKGLIIGALVVLLLLRES